MALVSLVGWGLLGSSLPSQAATPISSIPPGGLVLTTPHAYYVITQNLTYWDGTAITIAADDVTLDLSSRTLSNPSSHGGTGVRVSGANRVWIRNGTITGFGAGISLMDAGGTRIEGVSANRNGRGVELFSSDENTIQDTRTFGNDEGMRLTDSHRNTIRFSSFTGNGFLGLIGSGNDNAILYNTIDGEDGLILRGSRNTIQYNKTGGYFSAISVSGENNTVRDNEAAGHNVGIAIDGSSNAVERNTAITGPSGTAIEIRGTGQRVYGNTANATARGGWVGIAVKNGSTGNTLTYNRASGNGGTDLVDENPNCDSNLWERNYFGTRSQTCIH